jgi:hypothetical protein
MLFTLVYYSLAFPSSVIVRHSRLRHLQSLNCWLCLIILASNHPKPKMMVLLQDVLTRSTPSQQANISDKKQKETFILEKRVFPSTFFCNIKFNSNSKEQ